MDLVSWNLNGIRAQLGKGLHDKLADMRADVVCFQETKAHPEQVTAEFPDYPHRVWNAAERKGYSGTAIFSKRAPLSVRLGMGDPEHDDEGRVLTAEFERFFLTTVYTPNSKRDLSRLAYRQRWDAAFLAFVLDLERTKPVVFCGDLNVAHQPIDLANPKANEGQHGYTVEERQGFQNMLDAGYRDVFRHQHPGEPGHYSWWSWRPGVRERNVGWRLDYFLTSTALDERLGAATILRHVHGSDHCPVGLELDAD